MSQEGRRRKIQLRNSIWRFKTFAFRFLAISRPFRARVRGPESWSRRLEQRMDGRELHRWKRVTPDPPRQDPKVDGRIGCQEHPALRRPAPQLSRPPLLGTQKGVQMGNSRRSQPLDRNPGKRQKLGKTWKKLNHNYLNEFSLKLLLIL